MDPSSDVQHGVSQDATHNPTHDDGASDEDVDRPGTEDTLPPVHQGVLVARYRKTRKWTQQQLAEALRIETRTVQRMERQPMIRDLTRRRLLVAILGVPAGLLGLEDEQRQATQQQGVAVNDDRMAFLEDELATRREMYHTGGTRRAARGIVTWWTEIERFAAAARGTAWQGRALALLALSYQLQGAILADALCYQEAHLAHRKALQLGRELEDRELIAAALARRGVTFVQEERASEAIRFLSAAVETLRGAPFPGLRGYALQALSEAHAMARQPQDCWKAIGLAERILEHREQSAVLERTQAKIDSATVTAQKGVDAVLLGDYDRAVALIGRSLKTYDPTLVRARSRLLAQQAEAYHGLHLLDASVATAEDALALARSVGSTKTATRVATLHTALLHSAARSDPRVAHLGALLRE